MAVKVDMNMLNAKQYMTIKFATENRLFVAGTFWVSPFGTLEHQYAYFPEYFDAEQYAKHLTEERSKYDMPYHVYIDAQAFSDNGITHGTEWRLR